MLSTSPAVIVRRISQEEWREYKAIRLRALETDPESFSSTHEREAQLDDETWCRRTQSTVGLYMLLDKKSESDVSGEVLVGIAGAISSSWIEESETDDKGRRMCEIVSVWIAPEARGQGHAPRLLQGTLALAKAMGYELANISMKSCNERAVYLYTKLGFRERDTSTTTFKPDPYGCNVRLQLVLSDRAAQ